MGSQAEPVRDYHTNGARQVRVMVCGSPRADALQALDRLYDKLANERSAIHARLSALSGDTVPARPLSALFRPKANSGNAYQLKRGRVVG